MSELQPDIQPLTAEVDHAPPHIKAVYWEHVLENVPAVVEELQTSDIIGIEHTGLPEEEARLEYGRQATTYLSSTASEEEKARAADFLDTNNDRLLFEPLLGTDKKIVALDMTANHPDYWLVARQESAKDAFIASHSTGQLSQAQIDSLEDYITSSAESNAGREDVLTDQVRDLASEAESQGKEIALLLGATHTPVSHALAKEYPTSRVFIGQGGYRGGFDYDPINQAVREKRFFPEREIPREYLARFVLALTVEDVVETDEDVALFRDMTDGEVADMLVQIDEAKQNAGS